MHDRWIIIYIEFNGSWHSFAVFMLKRLIKRHLFDKQKKHPKVPFMDYRTFEVTTCICPSEGPKGHRTAWRGKKELPLKNFNG